MHNRKIWLIVVSTWIIAIFIMLSFFNSRNNYNEDKFIKELKKAGKGNLPKGAYDKNKIRAMESFQQLKR